MKLIVETTDQNLENRVRMLFYWIEQQAWSAVAAEYHLAFYLPGLKIERIKTTVFVWADDRSPAAAIFCDVETNV